MNISYYLLHLFIVTHQSFDFKLVCIFLNIIVLIILLSKKKTIITSPYFCINPTNYSLSFSIGVLILYSWVICFTLFEIMHQQIILDYSLYLESDLIGVMISTCGCVGEVDRQEQVAIPENRLVKLFHLGFGIFCIYYSLKNGTPQTEKIIEILPEVEKIVEAIPAATTPLSQDSLFKTCFKST